MSKGPAALRIMVSRDMHTVNLLVTSPKGKTKAYPLPSSVAREMATALLLGAKAAETGIRPDGWEDYPPEETDG